MELKEPSSKPFRFSDPRQERIHRRLLLVGLGPASFYRDACRLMKDEPPLDATTHLVAHLLRDIESALCNVLESVADRSERLHKKSTSGDEKHEDKIRSVLKALGILETNPVAQAWLARRRDFHRRAHRKALTPPRPIDKDFRNFWDDVETIFDAILEKFESRYLASHRLLDELLAKPSPTQSYARLLRNHIPNNLVAFGYFFDKLTSAAWLEPLRAEGFFKHPPEPDRDYEKGTVSFPPWPESRYLARMAVLAPEEVLEIALQIPDTKNVRVHEDLADAALAMQVDQAAKLVPKAKAWVESPYQLLLPEKLGALVTHLACSGQVDEALDLARVILTVLPDPRAVEKTEEEETYRSSPEPRARFDTGHYEQILKRLIPDLVRAAGEDALTLLCNLLEDTVRLSLPCKENEGLEDNSYIWRPAIEDHSQNHNNGLRDFLVSAVRDAAEALMETTGKTVLEIIERRPFKVFQRIGLHLRRKWPKVDPEGTACLVVDPTLFNDVYLHHELFHLLREQFNRLPRKTQQAYLALVAQGIDAKRWLDLRERESGHRPSREEGERYVRHWRYTKLWPIQVHLDHEWRQQFDALKQDFGELEHPDFLVYSTTSWGGTTSPKQLEDLRSMSIEELVSFLKTWQPSGKWRNSSREGLERELTALVALESDRFAAEARQFKGLDPTYVRALLSGLHDAVKQKATFPWPPVLDLCQWVLHQPREIPGREGGYTDLNPNWVWSRKAIGDLLSVGFECGAGEIPSNLRTVAWEVLIPLTYDPEPTPEDEARYGGSNMDPASLSINTIRGTAMHAVMRYALWVQRHIGEAADGKERITRGFDEIPEALEVLDHHLDPDHDPALAIRAVYGQWFPWLVLIDPHWATQSVAKIFPQEASLHSLHDAAWKTYITFCAPYDDVFDVLREEYGRAVERVSAFSGEREEVADLDKCLAEHLMTFYWRGKLNLNKPGGLLARFYAKASDSLRSHALEFVGRSLNDTKVAVPSQKLNWLRALWEQRINATRSAIPPVSHAELAAFSWWFASGKFDDIWAVAQLKEVLKLAGRVEFDHLVVKRLATLATTMLVPAVECLGLIVEGDREGWRIHGWCEHAQTILATALQSTDKTARQAAVALIHRLGARGYLGFGDLLSERG